MCLVNDRTRWTLSPPLSAAIYIRPLIKTLTVVMRCWHFQHLRREAREFYKREDNKTKESHNSTQKQHQRYYFFSFLFSFVYWGIEEKTHPICTNLYIAVTNRVVFTRDTTKTRTHTHTRTILFFQTTECVVVAFCS